MTNNNQPTKQLIILGNGFDLACGLKSSYSDFFQVHFAKIAGQSKIEDYYRNNIVNHELYRLIKEINFWDIIFISEYCSTALHANSEWNDIERIIYNVLHYISTEDNSTNLSEDTKTMLFNFKGIPNYSKLIFEGLIKFERYFNDYLFEQIKNNDDYLNSSVPMKLSDLINNDVLKSKLKNLSVLSFNYTLGKENIDDIRINPMHTYMLSNSDELSTPLSILIDRWVNIHGKTDNQATQNSPIIFGIDSDIVNKLPHNSPEYKLEVKFTKTFRVAISNFTHHINPLPKHIDLITFYGHSLSSADFSYFESIFDMYNLYSSNLKLEFYYGTYNPLHKYVNYKGSGLMKYLNNKNNQNMQKLMTNVYSLLENYGSTLNDNHGNNLLHRLLLEGRIAFKEDAGSFKLTEAQLNNI